MSIVRINNLGITDGTIVNADINSAAAIATSKLGAGAVLQVVTGEFASSFTSTSSTFVDTGLTASITPSSTSNKVLVILDAFGGNNTANRSLFFNIVRTSTNIKEKSITINASINGVDLSGVVLDSPSSTSSITYKMQIRSDGSGTVFINDTSAVAQRKAAITLIEIAA